MLGNVRRAALLVPWRADHEPQDPVLQYPAGPLQLGGGPFERRRHYVGPGLLADRSRPAGRHALEQVKQGDAKAVWRAGLSHLGGPVRRSSRAVPEIVHRFLTAGTSSGATI